MEISAIERDSLIFSGILFIIFSAIQLSYYSIENIVEIFVFLGITVYIPLSLFILKRNTSFSSQIVLTPTAISLFIAFLLPRGLVAALCSIPWVIQAGYYCVSWIRSDYSQFTWRSFDIGYWVSFSFLPTAAIIVFLSRFGARPFQFPDIIILLTAIHFHYAGFLVSTLFTLFTRHFQHTTRGKWYYQFGFLSILFGTPLVAAGITIAHFKGLFGFITVGYFAVSLIFLCLVHIWYLQSKSIHSTKTLAIIGHFFLMVAMCLAIYYSLGTSFGLVTISIKSMVVTHGILNGLGYVPTMLYFLSTENPEILSG